MLGNRPHRYDPKQPGSSFTPRFATAAWNPLTSSVPSRLNSDLQGSHQELVSVHWLFKNLLRELKPASAHRNKVFVVCAKGCVDFLGEF